METASRRFVLTLRILEHLAHEGRPIGVTALAQALGTTKSRIHRHLKTLAHEGYILQSSETDRYQVGTRLAALGRLAGDTFDLASVALPTLRDLRDALGHFSVVSQVEPERRAGARDPARQVAPSRSASSRGSLLPFHGSAQGKVALAFGDESVRAAVFRSRLELLTPKTIVSAGRAAAGARARARARAGRWRLNEALIGVNALAAPVFDAAGALVGTVCIVDSIQFIEEEPTAEQIEGDAGGGHGGSRHGLGSWAGAQPPPGG